MNGLTFNVGPNDNKWKFSNGNIVEKISSDNKYTTCVIGESINNKMCTQFDFEIKLKTFSYECYIGYITSTINESVKNWNHYLGYGDNKNDSVGFRFYPNGNYINEWRKGNFETLNYTASSNFKQGDKVKLSFNFDNKTLSLYHNESRVEILSLNNCKTITPAITMSKKNDKIEIIKYEIMK
eukprot:197483_1